MTITNLNDMVELITSLDSETKILHGYNFAILGYVIEKDHTKVAYSVNHIIHHLELIKKMSFLEATAYFDNHIINIHTGKGKPLFIYSNNYKIENDV